MTLCAEVTKVINSQKYLLAEQNCTTTFQLTCKIIEKHLCALSAPELCVLLSSVCSSRVETQSATVGPHGNRSMRSLQYSCLVAFLIGLNTNTEADLNQTTYIHWEHALLLCVWRSIIQRQSERTLSGLTQHTPDCRRDGDPRRTTRPGGVLFPFLPLSCCQAFSQQIRYSVPEELAKGSVMGNREKDLGLSVNSEKNYFTLSEESEDLLVNDRMDREKTRPQDIVRTTCLETVVENPLNVFHINIEIRDVNNNAPQFSRNVTELNISKLTHPGARFAVEPAEDPDVGSNSLQKLSP